MAKYWCLVMPYIGTQKILKYPWNQIEFTNRRDIESIFFLLKKQFNILQYGLSAVLGSLRIWLNSLTNFSLAAKMISMHSFDLVDVFLINALLYYRFTKLEHSLNLLILVPFFVSSTISFIIFWDFSMFYQNFLSPQVKRWTIISYKHGSYELLHEFHNNVRLRILEN